MAKKYVEDKETLTEHNFDDNIGIFSVENPISQQGRIESLKYVMLRDILRK